MIEVHLGSEFYVYILILTFVANKKTIVFLSMELRHLVITTTNKMPQLHMKKSEFLDYTALRGHTDIMRCILDLVSTEERYELLKVQDQSGDTTLHYTALRGHTDTIGNFVYKYLYMLQTASHTFK